MTIHIESETDTERIERCDHEGATEPLAGLSTVSVCSACGEIWPTRFGKGRGDCSDCLETRRSLLTKRESSIATGRMCRSRSYRSEPSTSIARLADVLVLGSSPLDRSHRTRPCREVSNSRSRV
jgi:hypothetical protein